MNRPYIVIETKTGDYLDDFNTLSEARSAVERYRDLDLTEEQPEGEYEILQICEKCGEARPLSERECSHCPDVKEQSRERYFSYRR